MTNEYQARRDANDEIKRLRLEKNKIMSEIENQIYLERARTFETSGETLHRLGNATHAVSQKHDRR